MATAPHIRDPWARAGRWALAALLATVALLAAAAPAGAQTPSPGAGVPDPGVRPSPDTSPQPGAGVPDLGQPSPDTQTPAPIPSPSASATPRTSDGEEIEACKDEPWIGPPSVECMTTRAVRTVFGMDDDGWVATPVLNWILRIPDFAGNPGSHVRQAGWLSESIAFALLAAIATFAVLHYWAAGLTGQASGAIVLNGTLRAVGAGLFILAWPFLFRGVCAVTNAITATLLPGDELDKSLLAIAAAGAVMGMIGGPKVALLVGIAVALVFVLLFLSLLLTKIGLSAGLLIAYVGMPLAAAIWPVPSLAAPATYAVRFIGMALSVLIMWAISLRVFGAVNQDLVSWGGDAEIGQLVLERPDDFGGLAEGLSTGEKLMLPLIGIAQLFALMAIPRHAIAMWNIAANGRGIVAGAVGFMGHSQLSNMAGRYIPNRFGGRRDTLRTAAAASATRRPGSGGSSGGGGGGTSTGGGKAKPSASTGANPSPAGSAGAGKGAAPGTPTGPGTKAIPAGALPRGNDAESASAHKAAMDRRQNRPPDAVAVQNAVERIDETEEGRYSDPLRKVVTGGGSDEAISRTLAAASADTRLPAGVGIAFNTLAAATQDQRLAALGIGGPSAAPVLKPLTTPPSKPAPPPAAAPAQQPPATPAPAKPDTGGSK